MGKSRNDRPFCGGQARISVAPARPGKDGVKQSDAQVRIINPITHKPYTVAQICDAIDYKSDAPTTAVLMNAFPELFKKIVLHPNSDFYLSIRGNTKADAIDLAVRLLLPKLEPLVKFLMRPQVVAQAKSGDMLLRDFIAFADDEIYLNAGAESTRRNCRSAVNNFIVPAIGNMKISDVINPSNADKIVKRLKSQIKDRTVSARRNAIKGYQCVVDCLKQYDVAVGGHTRLLSAAISRKADHNLALLRNLQDDHLTDGQRNSYIQFLFDKHMFDILFWVACIMCGLSCNEIAAASFGDIVQYHCPGYLVNTYLVTKTRRRNNTRWSTISACNNAFSMPDFRQVVFSAWATETMELFIGALHDNDFVNSQLADMPLSTDLHGKACNPDQMRQAIDASLQAAGLGDTIPVMRTNADGVSKTVARAIDTDLLYADAKVVVATICSSDPAMYHATFGLAQTEVDEKHYLHLIGEEYAITRYHYLMRYVPTAFTRTASSAHVAMYHIQNTRSVPVGLLLTSNYGIQATWSIVPEVS